MEPGELSLQAYSCWWQCWVGRGLEPHFGVLEQHPQHHRASKADKFLLHRVQLAHTLCSRGICPCPHLWNNDVALKVTPGEPCHWALSIPPSSSLQIHPGGALDGWEGTCLGPGHDPPAASAASHTFFICTKHCRDESGNSCCPCCNFPDSSKSPSPGLQTLCAAATTTPAWA